MPNEEAQAVSDPATARTQATHHKLSDRAREALRERIVEGAFPPGHKLREAELGELLGMSKSPIREALLQLEREGLVEMRPNRSTRVFSMDAAEIAELGEMRGMLEREALRLAMARGTDGLADVLEDVVARMRAGLGAGDAAAYKRLDDAFHRAIVAESGNAYLQAGYRQLAFRVQTLRNRLARDEALNARSLADHQRLLDLVREGRTAPALALMEAHVADTTRSYLARMEADTAPATAPRVAGAEIDRFADAALAAVGCDAATRRAVCRALAHASLHGVDTHGYRLLPHYLAGFRGGRLNPAPRMELHAGRGGAAILAADDAHGAVAGYRAVEEALSRAGEHGLGAVAIRDSSHFGAAGAYAVEIARAGMVGLTVCNSDSFVRLHGGAARFHGTNPIAFAAPVAEGEPWLLDMATSAIPFNRVQLSRSLSAALPGEVASDADGADVTDPALAEMLAPLGGARFGYKGAGLAGIPEILSAALSDAPLSVEIAPMISDDMATPRGLGAFVLALDPAAFAGLAPFHAVMGRYLTALRGAAPAPGRGVLAPGDREWAEAEKRRLDGISLDATVMEALGHFAEETGIAPLRHEAGGA